MRIIKRYIKGGASTNKIPASLLVNKLGKYLYKNLDGAYTMKTSSNTCDVYTIVLYQLPTCKQDPFKGEEYNDVHEMMLDLNITTYQNKIRVNIIEKNPEEKTLGCDVYMPEQLTNLADAKELIFSRVCKRIEKAYKDWIFLY